MNNVEKQKEIEVRCYREAIAIVCEKMSVKDVAKKLNVSKVTVYNDVKKRLITYNLFLHVLVKQALNGENFADELDAHQKRILRGFKASVYIIEKNATLADTASYCNVSKTTVFNDLNLVYRIYTNSPLLYEATRNVAMSNADAASKRGGIARAKKYKEAREKLEKEKQEKESQEESLQSNDEEVKINEDT